MTEPEVRALTEEELELLPYSTTDPFVQLPKPPNDRPITFGTWHNELIFTYDLVHGTWTFDSNDLQLTPQDWESYYPRILQLDNVVAVKNLTGFYNGKRARWSESNNHWQYFNHTPVIFSDPEELEVSKVLEDIATTLERTTGKLTPEQSNPVPGGLPETPPAQTPAPAPPPASTSTTPLPSTKGKAPAFHPKLLPKPPSKPPAPPPGPPPAAPPMAQTSSTKVLGSAPEPYDGSITKAEAFWTNLANYYYLNAGLFSTEDKRIAAALTHFKLGTPAGEWAKDRQQAALAQSPPNFGTWNDFSDAFKAHFIPVDTKLSSTNTMHTLKMGSRPFQEWYQEWSTHATRSGANEQSKMYAFRQNLPQALHQKLLGVSPTPTTLARLVELAKEFDENWRQWGKATSTRTPFRRTNTRAIQPDEPDSTNVNLASFPPRDPNKKFPKLSQHEKDKRRAEGRCLYCGKTGHWQDKCPEKPRKRNNFRPNQPRTRATTVDEDTPERDRDRPESPPTVARLYHDNQFTVLEQDEPDQDF